MLFVLLTLPTLVGGVHLALSLGNAVMDVVEGARAVREVQAECWSKTGKNPVVVELVVDAETARELLEDERVKKGRRAAEHFHKAGVL